MEKTLSTRRSEPRRLCLDLTMFEAMTLFRLPPGNVRTDEEARILQARFANMLGVEAAHISWNGRGYLRLSAQVYNAPAEYDKLAEGISDLLGVESPNSDSKGRVLW